MVDPFFFSVHMHESCDFHSIRSSQKVGCLQVEVFGVEIEGSLEIRYKPVQKCITCQL